MKPSSAKDAGVLDGYVSDARAAAENALDWLRERRAVAIEHFAELGFPTTRLEDWRYTNIAALGKAPRHELVRDMPSVSGADLDQLDLPDFGGERIVFVDGFYAPTLSRRCLETHTVEVASFASLLSANDSAEADGSPDLEAIVAREDYKDDALAALNFASWVDGLLIRVHADQDVRIPIHVLFVSTASSGRPSVSHPRLCVRSARNSRAVLIQDHVSLRDGEVFTNATAQVEIEDNARLEWILVQRECERARHLARQRVRVGRDARVDIHTLNLAAGLVRNDLAVSLTDEGAECAMNGLAIGMGAQHIDNHTRVDHAVPHCVSRQLYKAALAGESDGVFRGRIVVRPNAQRSDAQQQSKALLLSKKAGISAKPQLEIYADDVKCGHGTSIGQLDPEALFFLRSRGLDRASAYALLTQGFASEITDAISNAEVRDWLWAEILERLELIANRESGAEVTE